MEPARASCKIIPFPEAGRWNTVARKYVEHMLRGDPRAALYYLEFELDALRLSKPPGVLNKAIEKEYRRCGFNVPPHSGGIA